MREARRVALRSSRSSTSAPPIRSSASSSRTSRAADSGASSASRTTGRLVGVCHVGANVVPSGRGAELFARATERAAAADDHRRRARRSPSSGRRSRRSCRGRARTVPASRSTRSTSRRSRARPASAPRASTTSSCSSPPARSRTRRSSASTRCAATRTASAGARRRRSRRAARGCGRRTGRSSSRPRPPRGRRPRCSSSRCGATRPRGGRATRRRALRDLCRLLLERTPIVCLFVRPENDPAIRLYERVGMQRVGVVSLARLLGALPRRLGEHDGGRRGEVERARRRRGSGSRRSVSHASRQAALRPDASFPKTSATGPAQVGVAEGCRRARSSRRCAAPGQRRRGAPPTRLRGDPCWRTGTAKSAPRLARTACGSYGSAAWPVTRTASAPNASAERTIEPRFPGLAGRSQTTRSGASTAAIRPRSSRGSSRSAISSPGSSFPLSSAKSSGGELDVRAGAGAREDVLRPGGESLPGRRPE